MTLKEAILTVVNRDYSKDLPNETYRQILNRLHVPTKFHTGDFVIATFSPLGLCLALELNRLSQ